MKKKHLSRIVLNRILVSIIFSFVSVMIISVVWILILGRQAQEKYLIQFLSMQKDYMEELSQNSFYESVVSLAEYVDKGIDKEGPDYINSETYFRNMKSWIDDKWFTETDVIDPNGMIIQSTVPEHVGYDMNSDSQTAEFMNELKGIDKDPRGHTAIYDDSFGTGYIGSPLQKMDGYVRIGFSKEQRQRESLNIASVGASGALIGETGFEMVLDKDRNILWSVDNAHDGEKLPLDIDLPNFADGNKILTAKMYGVRYYVWAINFHEDYFVLEAFPFDEIWWDLKLALSAMLIICVIAFVLLYFILSRMLTRHVVKGVYSINDALKQITDGDLDKKADFRESIEFDELSDGINVTVDRLKGLIKEANERIDAELALAAKIQTSFLPHKFPAFPGRDDFDLYARMIPAKRVGGDFYDYFLVDDDHLALVMADVSDKGIPSAMFMAIAMDKIRHSVAKYGTDVAAAITEVNIELLSENDSGLFVTVWLGVVTLSTGHVDYVDAGHEFPAIYRAGNRFTIEEDVHNAPVAALKRMTFDPGVLTLEPGDAIFLYTDGITEANDSNEEMFRAERMLEALNRCPDASVEDIDNAVRSAVADFVSDAPQFDDMTTLVFRYNGKN